MALRTLAALAAVLSSGCSTYEVHDRYVVVGTSSGFVEFKDEDARLYLSLFPDQRAYAIGPPGVPLIPTYLKASEPNTIRIELRLTVQRERDFSFAQRPCLRTENQQALCASEASVMTSAIYAGSKQMKWYDLWKLDAAPPDVRVDRKRMYEHFGYTGKPELRSLHVTVWYVHKCGDACPKRFVLNLDQIVSVESLPVPARSIEFERTQQSSYRALAPVQ